MSDERLIRRLKDRAGAIGEVLVNLVGQPHHNVIRGLQLDAQLHMEAATALERKRRRIEELVHLPKSIFKSRTAWLGTLIALVPLLEMLTADPVVAQALVKYPLIPTVIGIAIIYLRKTTTEPVVVKAPEDGEGD